MHRPYSLIALFIAPLVATAEPPRTLAERSGYRDTSRHADVQAFVQQLAELSPRVRVLELGKSVEGRPIPLVTVAEPPVADAADLKKRRVILFVGNIHAGEVDGKEALLMLARDVALADKAPLLRHHVLAFVPLLNADGNERVARTHRPDQNGPEGGVGTRENASGFDLNRDFVKLETPEVRALVRWIDRWNPDVLFDMHTTNGSAHRHPMTYDYSRHPAGGMDRVEFLRDKLLPEVVKAMREQDGVSAQHYGTFAADHASWETYPAQPRYGVQYFGLRGKLSLLAESYTHAPFEKRVAASYSFAKRGLEALAARHGDVSMALHSDGPAGEIALRTRELPLAQPITLETFEEETRDGKRVATDKPADVTLPFHGRTVATLATPQPVAYLFPAAFANAVELLQRHGIQVEELREEIELDVEALRVERLARDARPFQGHTLNKLQTLARDEARRLPPGTVMVRTAQPLGTLAAYLLEPMSEDGMAAWNAFDAGLQEGADSPVLRLTKPQPIHRGGVRPLAEGRSMNLSITADMLYDPLKAPKLAGNATVVREWLPDGEHFVQTKDGDLRKVHARSGRSVPLYDAKLLAKSLATQPAVGNDTADKLAKRLGTMNPARTATLVPHGDDLYLGYLDGTPAVRLTKSSGAKEYASFSPDGAFVAFVRGQNLGITDVATQSERLLTTDGGGVIFNGKGDWVYEEEIFNRNGKAYWWSADGKQIAFLRIDDTPVKPFTVTDLMPTRGRVEQTPYPKAGDPNPLVAVGVVNVAGGEPRFADLRDYAPTDMLVCRVGWLGGQLYAYVQNRAQTWLDVVNIDADTGAATRLVRESTPAWIDDVGPIQTVAGRKVPQHVIASVRTGYRHLELFNPGGPPVALTSGEWEIGSEWHAAGDGLYVRATKDGATAANFYRLDFNSRDLRRLTPGDGTHAALLNPQGTLFIDTHSSLDHPARVRVADAHTGETVRVLDTNPAYEREQYRLGQFKRVQIPASEGFLLESSITLPPDFSPGQRYPVWTMTYAGPHTPTVADRWEAVVRLQDQVLAASGVVVFHVDPRSASGKGEKAAWTAYKNLGVGELKDLETAVDWLARNPWVDANRVGLSGHSYGGFMTAYALTHSTKFAAGISGAPVTDWRNYDSIYTERFMHLPQENPGGYDRTSAVKAAKDLHGKLLLLHGLMDDNVHVQNSVQFIDALQAANKPFEVMVYPQARHGIYGPHYQRQVLEFITRSVGGPREPSAGERRHETLKPGE